uniref:Uncharacterized protein n=1 Tax=Schistosoma haematobium TaxID=6185 RepID=A0A095ADP1_SCHHA
MLLIKKLCVINKSKRSNYIRDKSEKSSCQMVGYLTLCYLP